MNPRTDQAESIFGEERVLVLGAGGWLGSEFRTLLSPEIATMLVGTGRTAEFPAWNPQEVRAFAPTVVANFAFHLPARWEKMGAQGFLEGNHRATRQLLDAIGLPSVKQVLALSSGSAVSMPRMRESPGLAAYSRLKRDEEDALRGGLRPGQDYVLARGYSLSGIPPGICTYAFCGMVTQALTGRISVESRQPTWRRYISASDFLQVCSILLERGYSGTVESGGELVEMRDLADSIALECPQSVRVDSSAWDTLEPSVYASDNRSWEEACREVGFTPMDLTDQIRAAITLVKGSSSA